MENEEKSFWKQFKEFFSKAWKWIAAVILILFGIKIIKDKTDDDSDLKKEIKDKKKDIKQDQKEVDSDKKDADKKEEELKDKIKDTQDKISEAEKEQDKKKDDIGQFLPDLEKK